MIYMTDEAREKVQRLERNMKSLVAKERDARSHGRVDEADQLYSEIDWLSGEIARAYYAGLHP